MNEKYNLWSRDYGIGTATPWRSLSVSIIKNQVCNTPINFVSRNSGTHWNSFIDFTYRLFTGTVIWKMILLDNFSKFMFWFCLHILFHRAQGLFWRILVVNSKYSEGVVFLQCVTRPSGTTSHLLILLLITKSNCTR